MRTDPLAKVHRASDPPLGDVYHTQQPAVGAGAADAPAAVDWNEGVFSVGRSGDFVTGDAVFGDLGNLAAGAWIYDPESVVALIGDQ